jgi:hypothetical protein
MALVFHEGPWHLAVPRLLAHLEDLDRPVVRMVPGHLDRPAVPPLLAHLEGLALLDRPVVRMVPEHLAARLLLAHLPLLEYLEVLAVPLLRLVILVALVDQLRLPDQDVQRMGAIDDTSGHRDNPHSLVKGIGNRQ